jgi:hypothetical protein
MVVVVVVCAFLDYAKHAPETSPLPVLLRREKRAHGRARALETIQDLVRSLSLLSAKQDILRIAVCAWQYLLLSLLTRCDGL